MIKMKKTAIISLLLGPAALLAAGTANAALIDFTAGSSGWSGGGKAYSQTISPFGLVKMTSSGGKIKFNTHYDGGSPNPASDLAFKYDGVGIGDDEINGAERLTLEFEQAVEIYRLDFLDLFQANKDLLSKKIVGSGDGIEKIQVQFSLNGNVFETSSYSGNDLLGAGAGYLSTSINNLTADKLIFSMAANSGWDDKNADAALAAVGANAVVPIPAAAWLFGSALLGLVGVGRHRRRNAA